MNDVLRALIQNVVDNASTDGCSDDLIVTSKTAIDGLEAYLSQVTDDPIVVILSEGQIENIQIPNGGCVEVRDYDAVTDWLEYGNDGEPNEGQPLADWTEVDENGDRYASRVWSL